MAYAEVAALLWIIAMFVGIVLYGAGAGRRFEEDAKDPSGEGSPRRPTTAMDNKERETQWHLSRGGKQYGPFSRHELLQMIERDNLLADDLLWTPGYDSWRRASAIPGLLKPPPLPTSSSATTASSAQAAGADAPGHPPERTNALLAKSEPKPSFEGLRRLWRGQQPLWKAFWLYYQVGGIGAVVLAWSFIIGLSAALENIGGPGGADAGFRTGAFLALPAAVLYHLFAAVGTWRSASWRSALGVLARLYLLLSLSVIIFKYGMIEFAALSH